MKVAIVGGGIIGLSAAYEILRDGNDVTVYESNSLGHAASTKNAAKIALGECAPVPAPGVILQGLKWMTQPDSPLAIHPRFTPSYLRFLLGMARACSASRFDKGLDLNLRLVQDAGAILDDYRGQGMDFEMHTRGLITAFEEREHFEQHCEILPMWEKYGYQPERLEGDAVFEKEPALAERVKYAVYNAEDRQLDPAKLIAALREAIVAAGGTIKENTQVTGFDKTGDAVTGVRYKSGGEAGDATEQVDAVVLAPGLGLGELAKKLGVRIPIFSGKGYCLDYHDNGVELQTSVTLAEPHMVLTRLDGFTRVAGTMEFGAKDMELNPVRIDALRKGARLYLRDWPTETQSEFRQLAAGRPMTADGLPVIGEIAPGTRVFVGGGHGMLGLTQGGATGRILASMVAGRSTGLSDDHAALVSPSRFKF